MLTIIGIITFIVAFCIACEVIDAMLQPIERWCNKHQNGIRNGMYVSIVVLFAVAGVLNLC